MATLAELTAFAAKTTYDIPYVDYQVGVPTSVTSLKDYHGLPASGAAITYNAANNTVYVTGNNVVVSGYDFSGTVVIVNGNNVTVQNSKFDASFGWCALTQMKGFSGLVVDHNTFDGLKIDKGYAHFISSGEGEIKITYNEFKDVQSDALELTSGVVDHNYFHGSGYLTGAHADAIWVYKTTGPVTITNNFVDSRQPADAPTAPNNTVQIVNKFGDVHDVTVTHNVLLGGTYTVNVNDITDYTIDNVKVTDNFIAAGLYGDLYPNYVPKDLVYSGNGAQSLTTAIAPTVTNTTGLSVTGTAGKVGEVLQGTAGSDHIYGHGNGDQLIGGIGRDYLFGGKGEDHFVYQDVADSSGRLTDIIGFFEDGIDKIDLHALATGTAFGKVALTFIGDAAFNGTKGAIHTVQSGSSTWIEVDMNGDKTADMRIELQGSHTLKASDFILTGPTSPADISPAAPTAPADSNATATIPATPTAPVATTGLSVKGSAGKIGEVLRGAAGSDHIYGHGDRDQIIGGEGRDFLFSGKGEDHFVYESIADSPAKAGDVIGFFEDGIDKIDLHALATGTSFGHVALTFIGDAAFNGTKGAIHTVQSGSSTFVEVDMNGDKTADMRIELQGSHALKTSDFILTDPASPAATAAAAAPADPATTATISATPANSAIGISVMGTAGKVGEVLQGTAGSDHIYGHGNGDQLIGGEGRDFLFSGKGEDHFVYKTIADSPAKAGDVIGFFEDGIDKIDLHALTTGTSFGNVALTFIGGSAFNGVSGAVHAVQSGSSTFVEVDMNGDRVADMRIELQGTHHLSSADFLL